MTVSTGLYWLSFADGDRPKGEQFLGACTVRAADFIESVMAAHLLGINPGGCVEGFACDPGIEVPDKYVERLLTRAECEAMDRELLGRADR